MMPDYVIQNFWYKANNADYDFMRWSDFLGAMLELRSIYTDEYDPVKPDPTFGGGTITLSGDVTGSGTDSITTSIANASVTYAKMQDVAANSFLANVTGSSASVQEISTGRIPLFSSAITGTASSTTFLRGDGSWATAASDNIYTASGTLTGNRELTHGGYHLSFVGGTYTNRFTSTGRLILGATAEDTYLLDVNGTARVIVNNEFPLRLQHSNGNYMSLIVGDGSGLTTNYVGLGLNGAAYLSLGASKTVFHFPTLVVASESNTMLLRGGGTATSLMNSIVLASNTINAGAFTPTTGTQNNVSIGVDALEVWQPSSGSATYNLLRITPRVNTSGTYSGIVRGILVEPTLTSVTGATVYAFESTGGKIKVSDLAGTGTRMVTCDTNGVLGSDTIPSGGSSAISSLIAATATNTINNANYAQEWQWNSLTGTSASGLTLASSSTSGESNTTNSVLRILRTGANASSSVSSYGIRSTVSNTGSFSYNYGGYFKSSGGTFNFGLVGTTDGATGIGVLAENTHATSGTGYGLYASATGAKGYNYAGYFSASGATQADIGIYVAEGITYLNGALTMKVVTKSSTYTVTNADYTILCDASSGTMTINLPDAGGDVMTGRVYVIKKIDSSANAVTIDPTSSQTIDGSLTFSLSSQYNFIQIQSNGSNWFITAST